MAEAKRTMKWCHLCDTCAPDDADDDVWAANIIDGLVAGVTEEPGVSLADLIFQLRSDLNLAAWQGASKDPKFVVGAVELELSVVVDTSRGTKGSAKLWVADVAAERVHSSQVVHRITLSLQPIGPDGRPSTIAGNPVAGEEHPS